MAFTKLYQSWHRIENRDSLDQYARKVLLRVFLDERRRPWRREFSTQPTSPALDSTHDDRGPEEQMALRGALGRIPKRRRAVLILRYWMDLPVDQVAELLGCSAGTVRSQASRGLEDLRAVLGGGLELRREMANGRGQR